MTNNYPKILSFAKFESYSIQYVQLARFPITENARIEPGSELRVQHFHVGQYVDVVQRSVDFGLVDMVTRFHKKGIYHFKCYINFHWPLIIYSFKIRVDYSNLNLNLCEACIDWDYYY